MTRRPLRLLREGALWVGALLGLLAVAAGIGVAFLGVHFLVFRSGSMAPDITTGSLAVSRDTAAADLRPGQVVTVVAASGQTITHRVVSTTLRGDEASLVLRGDANGTADAEVYVVRSAPRVVVAVPGAGYAAAYLLTPLGLVVAASLSGMLLVSAFTSDRRRVVAVATGAAVIASASVAAGGVGGTAAAFTDRPTLRSGVLATHSLVRSTSITCSPTGLVFLTATMTFTVPVTDARYSYVLRLYNAAGAKVGADYPMTTNSAAGNATRGFTTAGLTPVLLTNYGVYTARVYSRLTATTSWESATFRSHTFQWGNALATNYLVCQDPGA